MILSLRLGEVVAAEARILSEYSQGVAPAPSESANPEQDYWE